MLIGSVHTNITRVRWLKRCYSKMGPSPVYIGATPLSQDPNALFP